jgi:isoleucyl-tRNA synthetase
MEDWPEPVPALANPELERWMAIAQSFDEAVGAARHAGKRKLRWPVKECVVVTDSMQVEEAMHRLGNICRVRANSRAVTVVRGRWERMGVRAEPYMKVIGPAFGKDAPKVKRLIENADGLHLKSAIERDGHAMLGDGGTVYTIYAAHVRFHEQVPEGVVSAPMKDAMVYVDLATSEELEGEGYTREVIRRLQEMRRQRDLRVEDFIRAEVLIEDVRIASLVGAAGAAIQRETRARDFTVRTPGMGSSGSTWELETPWDVEGIRMVTRISRFTEK